MGVVGPSSVADGLPLLHLSPYLSPPLPFSTAVVRLVALQIQVELWSCDMPSVSNGNQGTCLVNPYFLVLGLEGRLSSQSCDLTFHQSGEARGDAAQSAHSLCAHCGLRK